jgi:hypothetical protein
MNPDRCVAQRGLARFVIRAPLSAGPLDINRLGRLTGFHGAYVKTVDGRDMSPSTGPTTRAAFDDTDDNALVDGDFAAIEDELQTVLRPLRLSDINSVAMRHHMTGETTRYRRLRQHAGATAAASRSTPVSSKHWMRRRP